MLASGRYSDTLRKSVALYNDTSLTERAMHYVKNDKERLRSKSVACSARGRSRR